MPQFKHIPKGSAIGSGAYVFRHLGEEAPVSIPDYLCITAQKANTKFKLDKNSASRVLTQNQAFETSTDGINWSAYTLGTQITLANVGDKVYWRGNNTTVSESASVYLIFTFESGYSDKALVSGNIMSLLDKTVQSTTISHDDCFRYLFKNSGVASTPSLPATTLTEGCYSMMFYATQITTLPLLPATFIPSAAYQQMFQNCPFLKLSETQTGEYQYPFRIPASGTGTIESSYSVGSMFSRTGGTFAGTPTVNTTYYTDHAPV